jgi:pre-rRNA-processing protein IPI3
MAKRPFNRSPAVVKTFQHQTKGETVGVMLSEQFFSAVSGPPLKSNTAISKDIGLYSYTLRPHFAVNNTFKKSHAPVNGVAVSDAHVFAAQQDKAYIHVYSRLKGNQETFVSLSEKVRCVTLAGDVLVIGTAEGRIILWEVSLTMLHAVSLFP